MLYCTSPYSFKLLCSLRCSHALYCSSTLTLSTVSSVITLLFTVHTSSISKPLLLLWSPLKCLFLLESLVWPLLPQFLSIEILTSRFLKPVIAIYILRFLYTAEIYWFQTFISLSYCLLWCFFHQDLPNISFINSFFLVDPIVNLNYFVN